MSCYHGTIKEVSELGMSKYPCPKCPAVFSEQGDCIQSKLVHDIVDVMSGSSIQKILLMSVVQALLNT